MANLQYGAPSDDYLNKFSSNLPVTQPTASPTTKVDEEEEKVVEEPSQYAPPSDAYLSSTVSAAPVQEPVVSTEERLAQEPVEPSEPRSRKEMEQDEELMSDIKQHLKDRYDIDADERIPDFFTGYLFGGDEVNNEEILEQYMDRWRMMTGNTMDAGFEISWLSDLEDKENAARKAAEAGDDKAAEQANQYAEQRARALRVYQRADEMAGLFDSKRYEGMSALEAIGEIGETVGVNVAAAVSDPVFAATAFAGKIVGLGASASGASLKKAILKAAGTGAALEAVASAGTDIMVQQMEIEMGARDSIDYKRTAAVASIAATTAGVVSGVATRNATTRVDKVTRGELTEALKTQKEAQLKVAKETQKKLRQTSTDIREQLAASIEETYGKEAILRHSNGNVKELNSKFIRESEDANGLYKQVAVDDPDFIDPAMSVNTFERVVASTAELFDGVKKGTIKLTDEITGEPLNKKQLSALTSKLQPGEMVSERMLTILKNTADSESNGIVVQMLGKYGITRREIAAVMFADASKAGQKLNRLSQLSSVIGRAGRIKTAGEAAEEAEAAVTDKLGSTFRRLEDLRRLTLVSGVATAARNSIGQVVRSGVDTLVYGFDSGLQHGISLIAGTTPRKRFGFKNTFAQVSNTFFNSDDSATMAQFLLDHAPEQKARFYNMYSEITNKLAKKNPGQASMASKSNGLQSESPMLDTWENVITTLNFFNRFQEAVYRNGAFTTSIQRQLFDKGVDMLDVLKNGTITENIPEDMIAKAVDDALEFTYASQPKTGLFQMANNFIVKSGLTLAMPFPRFMFKAIENTYNYNITGAGTALTRMLLQKSRGQQVTDGMYRQLAEGVAGGLPMITLGYTLRDPENGMAGSEWYMLQDGKGNEFDARPYFPLTPYLLIGEIIHRYTDDRPIPDKVNVQELLEGFTGTNFRGAGPIANMTEDLFKAIETGGDDMGFKYSMATLGEYLGEAISGYGQPVYQLADVEVFGDMNQRKKDYNENPDYKDGVDAFFEGFSRPFEKRIGRIFENYSDMMSDKPDMADPRFSDPQNRVMPFMKLMFGATFTRVPPKYVLDLSRMGLTYRDFMTSTDTPSLNRNMNREMGYMMNMEMPEYLKTLREEAKNRKIKEPEKYVANGVKQYISSTKSLLYKFEQTKDDQSGQAALMNKFKRMSPYARIAAMEQYRERFGDKEPKEVEDWMELNNMAAQIRTNVRSLIGR